MLNYKNMFALPLLSEVIVGGLTLTAQGTILGSLFALTSEGVHELIQKIKQNSREDDQNNQSKNFDLPDQRNPIKYNIQNITKDDFLLNKIKSDIKRSLKKSENEEMKPIDQSN